MLPDCYIQDVLDLSIFEFAPGYEEPLVEGVLDTIRQVWPIGDCDLFHSSYLERLNCLSADSMPDVSRCLATEFSPANPVGRLNYDRSEILHEKAKVTG